MSIGLKIFIGLVLAALTVALIRALRASRGGTPSPVPATTPAPAGAPATPSPTSGTTTATQAGGSTLPLTGWEKAWKDCKDGFWANLPKIIAILVIVGGAVFLLHEHWPKSYLYLRSPLYLWILVVVAVGFFAWPQGKSYAKVFAAVIAFILVSDILERREAHQTILKNREILEWEKNHPGMKYPSSVAKILPADTTITLEVPTGKMSPVWQLPTWAYPDYKMTFMARDLNRPYILRTQVRTDTIRPEASYRELGTIRTMSFKSLDDSTNEVFVRLCNKQRTDCS